MSKEKRPKQFSKPEQGVYYTKEKGGYMKHQQTYAIDKTTRNIFSAGTNPATGPGCYEPKTDEIAQITKTKKPIQEFIKSRATDKMKERIKAQPKWHETVSTVPSIPLKHQVLFVPEEDHPEINSENGNPMVYDEDLDQDI